MLDPKKADSSLETRERARAISKAGGVEQALEKALPKLAEMTLSEAVVLGLRRPLASRGEMRRDFAARMRVIVPRMGSRKLRAHGVREPIPREPHRREFRFATGRRNDARRKHGRERWRHLERTVGMPQLVCARAQRFLVVRRDERAGRAVASPSAIPSSRLISAVSATAISPQVLSGRTAMRPTCSLSLTRLASAGSGLWVMMSVARQCSR